MSDKMMLVIIFLSLAFLVFKLAVTNRRIDRLFKSLISHEKALVRLMNLYVCDPDKNTKCNKTECYLHGGQCQMTSNKDFERTGECKDADDGK